MTNVQTVSLDPLRSVAFGSITTSYVALGTQFAKPVRLICLTNNTDGDMLFSVDAVTNHIFIPAKGFKLFDLTTNRLENATFWVFDAGTAFFVKYSTAPTMGAVYLEALWGQ